MPLGDLLLRGQALPDYRTWHRGSWEVRSSCIECWRILPLAVQRTSAANGTGQYPRVARMRGL
jgi:hypothetical protein